MVSKLLSEILYFPLIIFWIAISISFTGIVAKKPNLPVLIPITGIPKSFTKVMALKIVPSPPILINKSNEVSKVSKDHNH